MMLLKYVLPCKSSNCEIVKSSGGVGVLARNKKEKTPTNVETGRAPSKKVQL